MGTPNQQPNQTNQVKKGNSPDPKIMAKPTEFDQIHEFCLQPLVNKNKTYEG
jgi:hypothetical protein